jgi:hypothetical protein
MAKTANVRWFCYDWKERIKGSDLAKAIKEVEAMGRGSMVLDNAVDTGNDSLVTLVLPEGFEINIPGEEFGDLLGWAEEIHLDSSSVFWFKFSAQCGMPATDWLKIKDATTWINGLMASEELESKYTDESEKPEFRKLKAKALKLVNR